MFKNILIPSDGSEHSDKAVKAGVSLAKALKAKVTGVHVLQIPYIPPPGDEYGVFDPNLQLRIEEAAHAEAERTLHRIEKAAREAGVPFERVLLEQVPPWKGILEAAEKHRCDLIMMASHGRRGLVALVLGSETNKVLTHAKMPVLVYR